MNTFTLENETLRLEFNRETGALVGLTAVESDWKIMDRPHLGLSFRLLLPLRQDFGELSRAAQGKLLSEERRNNPVFGEKQKTASVTVAADRRRATFVWNGVTSEYGGQHPIKLTLQVNLTARQAVFVMTANRSDYTVENVYCPYLGDVQHPPAEEWFKTFLYNYATAQE
jgi:hypothetical protein